MHIKDLGRRIRTIRKENKLTQKQLATKIGIHPGQIVKYELGLSIPSIKILSKIADFCEISVDYLICGTDKEMAKRTRINDPAVLELMRKIDSLQKVEREKVKWAIEGLLNNK